MVSYIALKEVSQNRFPQLIQQVTILIFSRLSYFLCLSPYLSFPYVSWTRTVQVVCWPRLLPLSQPGVRAVAKQAKLFVVHLVYWTGHVELD